ncbi:hypothetical protein I79_000103 [Cricetulus griseus]|uniref:Uncharacterized protein n=1 Tax=Cricetulus griseus TaxID=10029 RepID=G3GRF7_CRIGR|nr:hypothetical protein I79_000103 [Cricetulus griseus]
MTTKAFRFLQRPYGTLGKRGRGTVWARKGIRHCLSITRHSADSSQASSECRLRTPHSLDVR